MLFIIINITYNNYIKQYLYFISSIIVIIIIFFIYLYYYIV